MGDVAVPLPPPMVSGVSTGDVSKLKDKLDPSQDAICDVTKHGGGTSGGGVGVKGVGGPAGAAKAAISLAQKVPPTLAQSSSSTGRPPSFGRPVKIVFPSNDAAAQPSGQRPQQQTPFKPHEIMRVGSAAESVVDSWTPDVDAATPVPQKMFDTAPYSEGDTEQSTLRLARPASRRGSLPIFGVADVFGEQDPATGSGTFCSTNPLRDEQARARRPLSRRASSVATFVGDIADGFSGESANEGAFDTANPAFGSGRRSVLSPIHSVVSSAFVVDLDKPISLDDLRVGDSTGGVGSGIFKTVPYSTSAEDTAGSTPSPRSLAVSTGHTTMRNASDTTDDDYHTDTEEPMPSSGQSPSYRDSYRSSTSTEVDGSAVLQEPFARSDVTAEAEAGGLPPDLGDLSRGPLTSPDEVDVDAEHNLETPVLDATDDTRGASAITVRDDGIEDNRISPFDENNASLWGAAAAAAARATAAQARTAWRDTWSLTADIRTPPSPSMTTEPEQPKSWFRISLERVGLVKGGVRTASARVSPRMPEPDSSAPEPHSSGSKSSHLIPPVKPDGGLDDKKAPAFGDDGMLGKTPMVSPMPGSDEDTAEETSSSTASDSPRTVAAARAEVEGDLEEGGIPSTHAGDAGVAVGVATDARVAVADASGTQAAAVTEGQMVLPCSPSDEEKISYYETGRFGLVASALVSFFSLSVGMWLFTIVTPAFYWFGVPAVFLIFYLGCHYFGVAVWGKDFSPETHADIVRKSEEAGYKPTVDVFLPVCREPAYLLANTWKYVSALDYPDVNVYVLDDGASEEVGALAAKFGFNYIVRTDRPALKKAGNLRYAFPRTSGEAIAIFDADFCPRPDFLKECVPYFGQDPSVGILQTPQYFRHRDDQTWIERGAGVTQEFFYRLVQMNQDKFNAAVCVGSCGLYRRKALEPFGGMAAISHSEDMYTGFKMTEHGYSIKYLPLNLAMGACPDEPQSFFMQQYRWCMGSATLVTTRAFWGANISKVHKLCFLNGMLYYLSTAMLIFLAPIPVILLVWMRADGVLWYFSAFAVPSLIFAGIIMPFWSTQRYGMAAHRVKVIQCYAHLYAIKDRMMGRSAPWVPSGAGSSRGASATYKSAVRLMVVWNVLVTALIVGGSAWRMTAYTWYHFVPAVILAIGSFVLNMSTLFY